MSRVAEKMAEPRWGELVGSWGEGRSTRRNWCREIEVESQKPEKEGKKKKKRSIKKLVRECRDHGRGESGKNKKKEGQVKMRMRNVQCLTWGREGRKKGG